MIDAHNLDVVPVYRAIEATGVSLSPELVFNSEHHGKEKVLLCDTELTKELLKRIPLDNVPSGNQFVFYCQSFVFITDGLWSCSTDS